MRRVIEAVFYALFIIVPLILTPWNYELFEFNKMLTVYAGTIIIASAWAIESIRQKKIIFQRTPFDLPFVLFLLSQVLSTIFSIDPHTSLWGYYSRFHGGLASTVSYLILFWAYSTFMRNNTKKSLAVILSTCLLVSLYGIAEHFGIDKHIWIQDVQNRVFSTLGQPNWLAAYLIMLIPLAWSQKSKLYWFYSLIYFITLIFTKSRSGFLGFGAAVIIYSLMRWTKITVIALVLGSLALIPAREYLPQFQESVGLANEVPAVIQGGSSTSDIRRVVWQGAVDIWKHYPTFGSGVETFAYSYYNFRPQAHNVLSEWDYLYNKAHNEFLNFLATTGAFGLGTYLLIIFWFSIYALKHKQIAYLPGFIGLAVSNFFGFSVVPVALLFFLFPAFSLKQTKPDQPHHPPIDNLRAIFITVITLATLYGLMFVAKTWRADFLFNMGRSQVKAGALQAGYQNLDKSVILSPGEPVFRNDLAEAAAQLAVAYSSPSAQMSKQFTDQAIKQSDEVIRQNPVSLNFWRSRIKVFLLLAMIDTNYYTQALEAFDRAISLSPTDAKLYYNLALVYNQLGQTGIAEQLLVKTIELRPNYEAARQNLGSLYEQTKRPELAREQYEYILQYLNPENTTVKAGLESL